MKHRFWSKELATFPSAVVEAQAPAGTPKRGKAVIVSLPGLMREVAQPGNACSISAFDPPSVVPGRNTDIQAIHDALQQAAAWVQPLRQEMGRVIVGQHRIIVSYEAEADNITPEHIIEKILQDLPIP